MHPPAASPTYTARHLTFSLSEVIMLGSRFTPFLLAASLAVVSLAAAPAARAQKLDDPTIVAIFDAANTWDVETGSLAAERGKAKQVRDFGAMLARDHKAVRQQGRDLATKLHVTPTPPTDFAMAKDHAAAMKRLRALRGAAFDQAFLAHEVAYHQAVIDAVQKTLLPALQNQEVKDLVTKVAPAFQAHMTAAANLQKQVAAN
jgi:putative membrane protein